jgi:hypothetical protein
MNAFSGTPSLSCSIGGSEVASPPEVGGHVRSGELVERDPVAARALE